jgi:hypothetical protein
MSNTIPHTVIDGFFDNPYSVREYGLKMAQNLDVDCKNVAYRGKRSKCLSEIHPLLFDNINRKILSSFYDLGKENISWKSEIKYQLTDESFDDGWVHTDQYRPSLLTGIIYLTPNAPLECGTSLYWPKNLAANQLHDQVKKDGNRDIELRRSVHYDKCRKENNDQFEKILTVNNLFNRLFIFDSHYFHCADRFFGNTEDNSRLTLVIFMTELFVNKTPITRIRSV